MAWAVFIRSLKAFYFANLSGLILAFKGIHITRHIILWLKKWYFMGFSITLSLQFLYYFYEVPSSLK